MQHRFQILLDEERYRKVATQAALKGCSVAAVIRDAIDRLQTDLEQRSAAVAAILAARPMPVPHDPADLRGELDSAHDRSDL